MSDFVFRLPDIGEGVAEAEILKWHVKAGDKVSEGQALADVMTDKATVEIAAPVTGTVRATRGHEGMKVPVGSELAVFQVDDGGVSGREVKAGAAPPVTPSSFAVERKPSGSGKVLAAPA